MLEIGALESQDITAKITLLILGDLWMDRAENVVEFGTRQLLR